MGLASREYVAMQGRGDRAACVHLHHRMAAALNELHDAARIEGFLIRELYTADDILDEDLDEDVILEAAEHQLPIVWVNVTYRTEHFAPVEFGVFEQRFGLRLVASTAE